MSTIMKNRLGLILFCCLGATKLFAQVGNDNPTGSAGEFEGSGIVTTGCHYNTYTGNARRAVTDLVVAGGVGAYPLEFTRTSNSRYTVGLDDAGNGQTADFGRGGNWLHSYQWTINCKWPVVGGKPTKYTVNYPDGSVVNFTASTNGDPYWRGGQSVGQGVRDRLQLIWDTSTTGHAYLIMPDGGKVWFSISKSAGNTVLGVIDPYGKTTTIVGSPQSGLVTITEPAGRWIKLYYIQT